VPRLVLALAAALSLAACGNARTPVPDVTVPAAPRGERAVALEQAGVRFTAPANWAAIDPHDPLVGGIESSRASLAVWRYPRTEPLPADAAALRRVQGLLVERARARDGTFALTRARTVRLAGARAIELTGTETIGGRRLRVRSSHVFFATAEIVLDAFAPPADFPRVDRTVFRPALASLRLTAPA
jgi:hypothetical protein